MKRNQVWTNAVLTTTMLAGFTPLANAQSQATNIPASPSTAPQTKGASGLEQIVVTAERRGTKLAKTPVSVTALSARALDRLGIQTQRDLQSSVAGLTVRATSGSNQLNFALRGQSVDGFTNSRPGVQPYLDEVAEPQGSGGTPLYDLQSIQVLKGPQGTLFGRNSTGGSVLLTSAQPIDAFGGYITQRVGDYGLVSTEGAVNVPILPGKIDLRVAGYYESRNGYQTNILDNSHPGSILRDAGRISLRTVLTDDLTNTLVVDYSHGGGSNANLLYNAYAPGSTNGGKPLNDTAALYFNPGLGEAIGLPAAWDLYLAAHPGIYPGGFQAYVALQKQLGHYTVEFNDPNGHLADNLLVSDITSYSLSPDTQIKNIFGFAHTAAADDVDVDGSPYRVIAADGGGTSPGEGLRANEYTEEIQILGKALQQKLSYVAGFYYENENDIDQDNLEVLDLAPLIPVTKARYLADATDVSYAGYAQGTYDLSQLTGVKGLGFTAGLRYTIEQTSAEQLKGSPFYDFPGAPSTLKNTVDKLSWQFGVQDQVSSSLLVYVVSRHSFRSGGFNVLTLPLPQPTAQGGSLFYPEVATDVEVGAKFFGEAASMPVSLNVALYNMWISNAQRSVIASIAGSPVGFTANVPESEVSGIEIDGQIRPTSWLNVGGAVAYADARFTNGTTTLLGEPVTFGPYADTPRWTGSVFAEASYPLPENIGTLTLRADEYAQTTFYFGPLGNSINPGVGLPGYALTNFRVGLDNIYGTKFSLAGYLRNAFDRPYFVGGTADGDTAGFNTAVPGEPRMFYFEATYKF